MIVHAYNANELAKHLQYQCQYYILSTSDTKLHLNLFQGSLQNVHRACKIRLGPFFISTKRIKLKIHYLMPRLFSHVPPFNS